MDAIHLCIHGMDLFILRPKSREILRPQFNVEFSYLQIESQIGEMEILMQTKKNRSETVIWEKLGPN